jgi:glutaminase
LDQTSGATRILKDAGIASPAPVEDFLIDLHERVSGVVGGKVADYIPQLGKADPATFGIALATVDGEIYATGDADHLFTIQSVSKPFMYGYALQHYGREYVLRHVGVEPRERPSTPSCSTRSPTGRSTPWSMPAPLPSPP